jgi:hypothetical protein
MLDRCCRAGFSRRIWFIRPMNGSIGPSSARCLISYFSESRYSSDPGRSGSFS